MLYTLGKALSSAGIFLRLKRGYERVYYTDYGNCGDRDIKDSDFWRIIFITDVTLLCAVSRVSVSKYLFFGAFSSGRFAMDNEAGY